MVLCIESLKLSVDRDRILEGEELWYRVVVSLSGDYDDRYVAYVSVYGNGKLLTKARKTLREEKEFTVKWRTVVTSTGRLSLKALVELKPLGEAIQPPREGHPVYSVCRQVAWSNEVVVVVVPSTVYVESLSLESLEKAGVGEEVPVKITLLYDSSVGGLPSKYDRFSVNAYLVVGGSRKPLRLVLKRTSRGFYTVVEEKLVFRRKGVYRIKLVAPRSCNLVSKRCIGEVESNTIEVEVVEEAPRKRRPAQETAWYGATLALAVAGALVVSGVVTYSYLSREWGK